MRNYNILVDMNNASWLKSGGDMSKKRQELPEYLDAF
jgi:hypothetical protein